jgi:hypothetical protein
MVQVKGGRGSAKTPVEFSICAHAIKQGSADLFIVQIRWRIEV